MTDTEPDLSAIADIDFEALGRLIESDRNAFVKLLNERFPAYAWAAEDEELGPILRRAVDEKWTAETFRTNFEATNWYTQRSEQQRQWDILEQTDPGEAETQLANATDELRRQALQMFGDGAVGDDLISSLAREQLRSGMSPAELNGRLLDAAEGVATGDYGAALTAARAAAKGFMVPASEDEVTSWTRRILTGELTAEGLDQLLREKAKSRFPSLSDLLDQGVNLDDYFSDHRQRIAQMMEMDPDAVDLAGDSRWAPILGFDAGEGSTRPMTVGETQQFLRTTNSYYKTANGRAEAASLKRAMSTAMGVA